MGQQIRSMAIMYFGLCKAWGIFLPSTWNCSCSLSSFHCLWSQPSSTGSWHGPVIPCSHLQWYPCDSETVFGAALVLLGGQHFTAILTAEVAKTSNSKVCEFGVLNIWYLPYCVDDF
jgi:hypothetical protein